VEWELGSPDRNGRIDLTGSHKKRARIPHEIAERMIPILRRYGIIAVLLLLFTIFSILRPGIFPSLGNLIAILKQIALLGIISTGLTVCLILGDFDLSIAAVATWSGVLIASLLPLINMWVAIVAVLSMAVGVGLVNGFFSAVVGISPFIVTLAVQTMLRGLTLWYTGGYSLYSGIPRAFVNLARGTFLSVPYLVYYMLFIFLVFYAVINHSSFGKKVYAVGGNPIASGILLAARLSSGQPRAGEGLLLNAFAAVFLGAATFHGGRFHVAGTLVGVLFIGVLNNGLVVLGIPFYLQYVIQGAVLVLAIAASRVVRRT